MTKNGTRGRFRISLGLPRSSSFCAGFSVSANRPRGGNCENVLFLWVSRLMACLHRFVWCQIHGFQKFAKKFSVQKNGANVFLLSHVSDHFWRTVFRSEFSCGPKRNAFLAPHNARKMPFQDHLERHQNRRFGRKFPLSLWFRKVAFGNFARRGRFNLVGHQPPGNCRNKLFGVWGFAL